MPVLFDSSASGNQFPAPGNTTASVSATHSANSSATGLQALVACLWMGNGDASGATFSATFGGVSMTLLDSVIWNSNKHVLNVYTLASPPTGSQTVVAAVTGMTSTSGLTEFLVGSTTYSGIASIGSPVHASASNTASNSVTVSSTTPAHRVVGVHAVGVASFLGYNQTVRALEDPFAGSSGSLLMGDAPGAATVAMTAVQALYTDWAAIGVDMTPATVTADVAGLALSIIGSASGAMTNRVANPDPHRVWVIPA